MIKKLGSCKSGFTACDFKIQLDKHNVDNVRILTNNLIMVNS